VRVWSAIVLACIAGAAAPGCGAPARAEPLEVTYYYLPG
jgi:hypothetical protein